MSTKIRLGRGEYPVPIRVNKLASGGLLVVDAHGKELDREDVQLALKLLVTFVFQIKHCRRDKDNLPDPSDLLQFSDELIRELEWEI